MPGVGHFSPISPIWLAARRETSDAAGMRALTARPVAASIEELLDGATAREPFLHSDAKSGVGFERVVIGGEPFSLKHVHSDDEVTAEASMAGWPPLRRAYSAGVEPSMKAAS